MITKFDKTNLNTIRAEINAVLSKYADSQGITLQLGNIKFTEGEFDAKLNAKIVGAKTRTDTILESVVASRGLQTVGLNGRKLVSYNTRSYKYPFVYEQNGKRFKCSTETAMMYFKK